MSKKIISIEDRFFNKVQFIPFHSCWEWTGGTGESGHGVFWIGTRFMNAHRFSFLIHKYKPSDGLVIMHSCDNPTCVNPDHLSEGTQKQNIHDAMNKGRLRKSLVTKNKFKLVKKRSTTDFIKKICIRGHDLSIPGSFRFNSDRSRGIICKECNKLYQKKYALRIGNKNG